MKTFSQTRATFLEILEQLKRLEGPGEITRAMRVNKKEKLAHSAIKQKKTFLKQSFPY